MYFSLLHFISLNKLTWLTFIYKKGSINIYIRVYISTPSDPSKSVNQVNF